MIRSIARTLSAAAVALSLAVLPVMSKAEAAVSSAQGRILAFTRRSAGHPNVSQYQLAVTVDTNADGRFDIGLVSGGTYCPGIPALTSDEQRFLADAANQGVTVRVEYLVASTGSQCVVGFSLIQ